MALEEVGIGGFLSFDSDSGIASMSRAQRAFARLEGAFNHFKGALANAGNVFSQFNLMSVALAGAGVAGVGALAHSATQAAAQFESMQVQLATTFNVLQGGGKMVEGMAIAKKEMKEIELLAAKAPGGAADLLNIYKQIVGPMAAQGRSLEQVRDMTFGAAIAARGLGLRFDEMGFGLSKLISGSVQSDDMIYKMAKSVGLIREDAAAWNALSPETRFLRLQKVMAMYAEAGDQIEKTWEATASTTEDILTMLKRAAIGPLFDFMKEKLSKFNDAFLGNQAGFQQMAEDLGAKLLPAFEFAWEIAMELVDDAKRLWEWLSRVSDKAMELSNRLPISQQSLGDIGIKVAELSIAFGTLVPMLSLLGTFLGPVKAVMSVVWAGLQLIGPLLGAIPAILSSIAGIILGPVAVAAAAIGLLFLVFRKDNESFMETVSRLFNDVLVPAWEGFKDNFLTFIPEALGPLQDAWDSIKASFTLLMDSFSDTLDVSSEDAFSFGAAVGSAFAAIGKAITTVIGWVGQGISLAIYMTSHLIWAFKVAGQRIGEAMALVYIKTKNLFANIFNVMTEPLRDVLKFISETITKVANTRAGGWALDRAGISDDDVKAFTRAIDATITTGPLGKAEVLGIPDWGALPESPEEAHMRKELARRAINATQAKEGEQAAPPPLDVKVENKVDATFKIPVQVDGKNIANALAKHQLELNERAGASTTPWQRRQAVVNASSLAPVGGSK